MNVLILPSFNAGDQWASWLGSMYCCGTWKSVVCHWVCWQNYKGNKEVLKKQTWLCVCHVNLTCFKLFPLVEIAVPLFFFRSECGVKLLSIPKFPINTCLKVVFNNFFPNIVDYLPLIPLYLSFFPSLVTKLKHSHQLKMWKIKRSIKEYRHTHNPVSQIL